MNKSLSIVIVTWNSWPDLQRCLASLGPRARADDCEILVVDNGSADGTATRVRERFPEVVLLLNERNLGLPAAINQGLDRAAGEFVMLLDVDTEVHAGCIDTLLDFMHAHPEAAVAAPRIYSPDGRIEQSARNLPSISSGLFGRQSTLARWFPGNPYTRRYLMPENLDRQDPFRVEQVSAACMFMRRSAIADVGRWDEAYRCYWVDSDWCARLKAMDKAVYCVPRARIVHHENNQAGKKKAPWRIWHFHIAAYRLYRKHYTRGALDPRALLAGIVLMSRAALMFALNALKKPPPAPSPTLSRDKV